MLLTETCKRKYTKWFRDDMHENWNVYPGFMMPQSYLIYLHILLLKKKAGSSHRMNGKSDRLHVEMSYSPTYVFHLRQTGNLTLLQTPTMWKRHLKLSAETEWKMLTEFEAIVLPGDPCHCGLTRFKVWWTITIGSSWSVVTLQFWEEDSCKRFGNSC